MQLAQRVAHMTGDGSDGWEILFRAREMIAAGEAVLNLTIGEPDIKTAPEILEAMHESAMNGATGYSGIQGIEPLRAEIAARVTARTGVATTPAEVIVTPGGQAGLYAAHQVLLDAGQTGLCIDPHYPTYPGTIRAAGGLVRAVPAAAEAGFQPDPAALARAARESGARTLLINSPNNPTGALYSRATLEAIAEICIAQDLWLISDEVYDTQVWEGTHISPRALPGMQERTVVLGSLSKSHAMTGSRIGWIVAPEPVIAALHALNINTTYGLPGFIQEAALFALRQGPAFEAQVAEPFHRRRDLACRVLANNPALRVSSASGAMYVMADIRATGMSGEDFARKLLAEEKIALMPGESFGASAAGHLRIALTLADDQLEVALTRLADFARRQLA